MGKGTDHTRMSVSRFSLLSQLNLDDPSFPPFFLLFLLLFLFERGSGGTTKRDVTITQNWAKSLLHRIFPIMNKHRIWFPTISLLYKEKFDCLHNIE